MEAVVVVPAEPDFLVLILTTMSTHMKFSTCFLDQMILVLEVAWAVGEWVAASPVAFNRPPLLVVQEGTLL